MKKINRILLTIALVILPMIAFSFDVQISEELGTLKGKLNHYGGQYSETKDGQRLYVHIRRESDAQITLLDQNNKTVFKSEHKFKNFKGGVFGSRFFLLDIVEGDNGWMVYMQLTGQLNWDLARFHIDRQGNVTKEEMIVEGNVKIFNQRNFIYTLLSQTNFMFEIVNDKNSDQYILIHQDRSKKDVNKNIKMTIYNKTDHSVAKNLHLPSPASQYPNHRLFDMILEGDEVYSLHNAYSKKDGAIYLSKYNIKTEEIKHQNLNFENGAFVEAGEINKEKGNDNMLLLTVLQTNLKVPHYALHMSNMAKGSSEYTIFNGAGLFDDKKANEYLLGLHTRADGKPYLMFDNATMLQYVNVQTGREQTPKVTVKGTPIYSIADSTESMVYPRSGLALRHGYDVLINKRDFNNGFESASGNMFKEIFFLATEDQNYIFANEDKANIKAINSGKKPKKYHFTEDGQMVFAQKKFNSLKLDYIDQKLNNYIGYWHTASYDANTKTITVNH